MAKRTTRRLGLGDYVSPDPEDNQSVFIARIALIEATRNPLPEFLQTLFDKVFPEYCRLVAGHPEFREFTFTWQMFRSVSPRTEFEQFNGVLTGWARRFNAEEDWVLPQAWRALHAWDRFPESRKALEWWQGQAARNTFLSDPFRFEFGSWWVQTTSWTRYRADMQKAFDQAVKEFESKARAAARSHGLIPAPRTHSPANFKWFVLYQFAGFSSTEIASRGNGDYDDSTILKGVKAVRRLVGWKRLRPGGRVNKNRKTQ
jgi:hypothetical protein